MKLEITEATMKLLVLGGFALAGLMVGIDKEVVIEVLKAVLR